MTTITKVEYSQLEDRFDSEYINRKRRIPQTTRQKVSEINSELHSQPLSFFF